VFRRLDPFGNPNVGVFVRATETHVWAPPGLTAHNLRELHEALGQVPVEVTVGGSTLIGSLVAGNSHGIVVADFASDDEVRAFRGDGLNVVRLEQARLNAAGNNILCNDRGALCHPELSRGVAQIVADTLDVELQPTAIAGVPTVGTAAVATTAGVLCHPLATEAELAFIKQALHAPARIGTVNHGHGLVGAGLAANSHGVAVGSRTTGIELGRIEEALGFLEKTT
jgi:translation initiation factor 6